MAGCGSRAPETYRLLPKALVPPGVATPELATRTITVELQKGTAGCSRASQPMEVRRRGNGVRVTVTAADLNGKPPGWLRDWATGQESKGCIAPGEGLKLGERIVESMPLDSMAAFRLMHASSASYVDLGPENRLQVDSPILRDGAAPDAKVLESAKVSQGDTPYDLRVEVKTTADVVGFETAWYAIRPKERGVGFQVAPLYAESHIQGTVDRRAEPRVNYFRFRPEAAFFRTFYRGDRTIILVSAPTPAELDRETEALKKDGGACATFPAETCVLLPQNVGMNPHIAVTVNGKEVMVRVGASVRVALVAAGERNPEPLVPRLTVRKLYAGRPAPVQFDPADRGILNLILVGGEEISWK
jgi:hypothetical protein